MADSDTLALIDQIYAAALDPRRWPDALTRVCAALGDASAILALHPLTGGLQWSMTSRIDPASIAVYGSRFSSPTTNPYLLLVDHLPVGEPLAAESLAGPENFEQTDFYRAVLQPQQLRHSVVLTLFKSEHAVAGVAFLRGAAGGPFTSTDLDLLRTLAPHLQRSVELTLRAEQLARRSNALAAALSISPTGMLLVDALARVEFTNPAASRIIAGADGLSLVDGSLRIATRGTHQRFLELLQSTAGPDAGTSAPRAHSVLVPRLSGAQPYTLVVWPLSPAPRLAPSASATALVLVTDPLAAPQPATDLLVDLFGLTRAESAVAALLVGGFELKEVAARLGVTVNTAKSHLRQIFAKTNTRRQVELVRLLLQFPSLPASAPPPNG